MSGLSPAAGSLVVADYVVFPLMLVVSAGICVFYTWVSRGKILQGLLNWGTQTGNSDRQLHVVHHAAVQSS